MFEREQRTLQWVPRWPILRVLRRQDLAQHHYYVALYSFEIAKLVDLPQGLYPELMHHALTHDWDELITGDIPSPAKRGLPVPASSLWLGQQCRSRFELIETLSVGPTAMAIVKLADALDGVMYLAEERNSGNKCNVEHVSEYMWQQLDKAFKHVASFMGLTPTKELELMRNITLAVSKNSVEADRLVSE